MKTDDLGVPRSYGRVFQTGYSLKITIATIKKIDCGKIQFENSDHCIGVAYF